MAFGRRSIPRALSIALVAAVLAGVAMDPYTWFRDAGDAVMPAPWWQKLLGWGDVTLLIAALVMAWRRRYGRAFALLVTETAWAIGAALILIHRDGEVRFIRGFGAEPYLAEYLTLHALRLATMASLWIADSRASRGRTARVPVE